ncbi:Eukaryotic translation initiation factor 4 gamma 1 [Pleodorina starrii]|uniref:Eukaryotic translation initiation factor 4 gamma 1 n=1 Tax=Pleodorina starrii TaxID=330485 RepID=A0A9W6BJL2_9CHLO|nr:hypothetical protein PLESTM_000181100 [Pleodorina starrii]GLC53426.1 Eukaryotic translation initiation factor 4 gamma 1 [Pleodorina starrii]GLC69751.1 hypothetical protein PLESTF_000875800 [Pleodorina starrii]
MAPSAPSLPTTTEANQQEAVALCLERLRPGHFQAKRLAFEIRDVGFTPAGSLGTLQLLVRWIFDRAMTEPERFAAPCASLCFSLTPILPTFKPPGALTAAAKAKRIDFRQTLLNLCQREFEAACTSAFSGEALPEDAAKPTGSSLSGSLQFLACLYLHHLLTDRIMLSCLATVASGSLGGGSGATTSSGEAGGERPLLSGSNVPQRIECLVRALLIAGRQLDECLAEQYRPVLDGLYDQLAAHKAQAVPELAPDVQAALSQLLEFRAGRWANGGGVVPGLGLAPPAAGTAAPARAYGNVGVPRRAFNSSAASSAASSDSATAAAVASPKPAKGIGVTTIYRSSGRLVVAAPGSAAAAVPSAAAVAARRSSSPGTSHGSAPAGSEADGLPGPSAASALLARRQQPCGGSRSSSGMLSRPASVSQNLEGLWELSPETYSDVRTQLLAQPVENSPATLEAMADELVESAIAASGGDAHSPCWGAEARLELRPLSPAVAAEPAANTMPVSVQQQQQQPSPPSPPPLLSDEEWAELVQQQWEAQFSACDIYVRLCVDALQQMSAATPPAAGAASSPPPPPGAASGAGTSGSGSASCNGAAEPSAAAAGNGPAAPPAAASGGTVGDTGRAFRRLLLSSAQTHFERCLAALLPVPPSPSPSPSPSNQPGQSTAAADGAAAAAPRRAWGDMPAVAPDAASALPRARGVCQLLSGLLRYGLLTPRIVLHCAAALVDGAAGGSAGCLQCACILLAGAGKQARTFKVSEAAAFESLLKRLHGLAEADKTAGSGTVGAGAADSGNENSYGSSSNNNGNGTSSSSSDPSDAEQAYARELRRRFVSWLVSGLPSR